MVPLQGNCAPMDIQSYINTIQYFSGLSKTAWTSQVGDDQSANFHGTISATITSSQKS